MTIIIREDCSSNKMVIDDFEIQTWYSKHVDHPYIAVNMTICIDRFKGYDLTEDEKTDVTEMMAGYCRLAEEHGLVGFGETEFESIQDLFSHAVKVDG